MTNTLTFLPTAGSGPAWDDIRARLSEPPPDNPTPEQVRADLELRDLLSRYSYNIDIGDIDAVMALFADDCVFNNPRGTFVGAAAIRSDYEHMVETLRKRFHLWSNVVTRVADSLRDAWMSAYFYALVEPADGPPRVAGGVVTSTLVKQDGAWHFTERTVLTNLEHAIDPV